MAQAVYAKNSPYYATPQWGQFLDVWTPRHIPSDATDALFEITSTYTHRPDLLAYDLYADTGFWWVFAVRNPDVITDPIFDFVPGNMIYVPTRNTIKTALGV